MFVPRTTVQTIVSATFPDFRKQRVRIIPFRGPVTVNSYWSEGHRDYWCLYSLTEKKVVHVPDSHPYFNKCGTVECRALPPNTVLVQRTYSGTHQYLTIYGDLAPMLPKPVEVSEDEQAVLLATARYKNTYAGRTDIRFHESGLPRDRWDAAFTSCVAKKWLRKNGSLTLDGRNIVETR